MEAVRTRGGVFYGWIDNDGLFNRAGQHVGQIYRGIVYDESGLYLGEFRDGRLVTDILRKDTHRWYGFFPNSERLVGDDESDGEPLPMPEGYEDFPDLPRATSAPPPFSTVPQGAVR